MRGDEYINSPQHFLLLVIKEQTHMLKKKISRIVAKKRIELCTEAKSLNTSWK